jgi:hypothetical protein
VRPAIHLDDVASPVEVIVNGVSISDEAAPRSCRRACPARRAHAGLAGALAPRQRPLSLGAEGRRSSVSLFHRRARSHAKRRARPFAIWNRGIDPDRLRPMRARLELGAVVTDHDITRRILDAIPTAARAPPSVDSPVAYEPAFAFRCRARARLPAQSACRPQALRLPMRSAVQENQANLRNVPNMRTRWLALAAMLSCIRFGSDPDSAAPAGTSDAGSSEGGGDVDAGPCDPSGPFGDPVNLAGDVNTEANELGATLTVDESAIYFAADGTRRDAGAVLYRVYGAVRGASGTYTGSAIVASLDVDGNYRDVHPAISGDGLTIVFPSDRDNPTLDLYAADRDTPVATFRKPVLLAAASRPEPDSTPFLGADGTLYFASGPALPTQGDIFVSTRGVAGYGPPSLVEGVNLSGTETNAPVVTADGKRMYFATNRADASTRTYAIWTATRTSTSSPFANPEPVAELGGIEADERPSWISRDGCRLYFSSRRAGGRGGADVWVASKTKR